MNILTYGDIIDGGNSVFNVVCQKKMNELYLDFRGVITISNPYKHLQPFLDELDEKLSTQPFKHSHLDFTGLEFCNSNGFYILMDIIEKIYGTVTDKVTVKRVMGDDWHQNTLPVLLNIDENKNRTIFEDCVLN